MVIPTYNRARLLRRTLQGLCGQHASERMKEVIVVSDGCTDDTSVVIAEFAHQLPVRLITAPKKGVSAARNRGLSACSASLVLLLDDDVVPSPGLVREHTNFHLEDPRMTSVLLGYVAWLPELPITPFMRWYGEHGALFGFALLKDGGEVERRFLYTCNISFKIDLLRAVDGFNESLTVFEDHELGFRLAKHGMRMTFRRSALGYHNQSFTFQQACDRVRRYSGGFAAFLSTEAGREMAGNESAWKKRLRRMLKRDPATRPARVIQRLLDSNHRLPHAIYRAAYWYFATLPASAGALGKAAVSDEQ